MATDQKVQARRDDGTIPGAARAGAGLRHEGRRVIGVVQVSEDIVHYAVAILLVAVAAIVLVKAVLDFLDGADHVFAERITGVINSVLFVIIVMEILRTVVAHFDDAGLQLKPFLIIGIISAVRHILTVGAQVSLGGDAGDAAHFRRAQTELGVNAAVVLALVIGLVMVWRSEKTAADSAEIDTTQGLDR
jgi:uncharacterized membrane protein (DUF373 family)